MAQLEINRRKVNGGVVILDLAGDICLGEQNLLLKQTLRSLIEQNEKKIVLNMAGVTRIDSSGLGELVSGYASVSKGGGELKLLNLSDRVTELMNITKLLTVFEIFEDEEAAVASFPLSPDDLATINIERVSIRAVS